MTNLRPITASLIIHLLVIGLFFLEYRDNNQQDFKITVYEAKPKTTTKSSSIASKNTKTGFSITKGLEFRPNQNNRFNYNKEINKALEDLNEQNILKKKEFIYSNFYTRIKKSVDPEWINALKKYFYKNRPKQNYSTAFLVIIDNTGKVVEIVLVKSSGDDKIDNIALNAMRNKMFPNPPKDLIESDGYGRITWIYNIYK